VKQFHALILAGGFGTRLMQEIAADTSGRYDHLNGSSKGLIPLPETNLIVLPKNDSTIAGYWVDQFKKSERISKVGIGSNRTHYEQFFAWKASNQIDLLLDHNSVEDNKTRNGTVKDWEYFTSKFGLNGPLVTVACDLLFYDFDLNKALDFYEAKEQQTVVGCYKTTDLTKKGIISIDGEGRIKEFYESPGQVPADFKDEGWRCAAFYILNEKANTYHRQDFIQEKEAEAFAKGYDQEQTRALYDSPGQFIQWLINKEPVFAYKVQGRFDIGSKKDLERMLEVNK